MVADMPPTLTLTCPRCRAAFASSMQLPPETFDDMTLGPTVEKCRSCGHISRFEKRDYRFEGQGRGLVR